MISRPQLVRIGYWVLAAYVAVTGVVILVETTLHNSFTDHAAPIFLISLFIVIPLAVAILFLLNWRCRKEHSRRQRIFMHAVRALLLVAWLFSCLPVAFVVSLTQPWPLTLRNGPDTGYARDGFTKHAGFAPPSSVSQIYYRVDGGWLDVSYLLRFDASSPDVVSRMAAHHNMTKSDTVKMGLSSTRGPKWWRQKKGTKGLECYFREKPGSYYWYLWYDPETGTVWYKEFSV